MRIIILTFVSLLHVTTHAHSVFIIVHGTWSSDSSWYMSGGDFFDALEKTVKQHNAHVTAFRWSGNNTHHARENAAQNLAKLIQTYDPATTIHLIGHSHGGNVCTLASQLLASDPTNQHHITTLFVLGTPTRKSLHPNMTIVHYFYNLFSFEDLIQPVCAIFEREYQRHERIANIRVFINSKEPDHAGLHNPLVAQWIPHIHEQFTTYITTTHNAQDISHPSIIYLNENTQPYYAIDTNRKELIDKDIKLSLMMLNVLQHAFERKFR